MRTVSFRSIENNDSSIKLTDLYRDDYTTYKTPFLEFINAEYDDRCWDNDEYLIKFFRGIKNNKKKHIRELQHFCVKNKLDYTETLYDLLEIYKLSKKLIFWKEK